MLMYLFIARLNKYKISSTRVQHKVGSRDEMRWNPDIIGPWVARVPADHAWRAITRADEMERNGWDEYGENSGMKFVVGENGWNPAKNLPRPRFVHHETHMEGPRRELYVFLNSYSKSAQKLSTIYLKETIGANTRDAPLLLLWLSINWLKC